MRRGHSDGEVLGSSSTSSRAFQDHITTGVTPWMDASRQPEGGHDRDIGRTEMAARRTAMIMEDRRRRLSGHSDRHDWSTTSSAPSPSHRVASRPGQNTVHSTSDRPLYGLPNSPGNLSSSRLMDRPLPRHPGEGFSRDRQSREITLPTWQLDGDISKCPICGNTFTFWYRKHHCRKCGRVVCANCSPHRITIPRQFIVHPPDISALSPSPGTDLGIETVNLTRDDSNEETLHSQRPLSSDYRIDPALGGGQEVRLCNPCVPDPNPMPHMPYASSNHRPSNTPHRIACSPSSQQHDSVSAHSPSTNVSLSHMTSRLPSGRHEHDLSSNIHADFNANLETFGPPSNRRHSHTFRLSNHAMPPPRLPTVYGSAPDQSSQQVSLI